jgi:prolyl 4-hydroxylase
MSPAQLLGLLALASCCFSAGWAAQMAAEEKLIGWSGETFKPNDPAAGGVVPNHTRPGWVESIAWKPRAFIYHNFMSEEECNHLMQLAAPQMKRSTVVGANGSSVEDDYRTSYGTFLRRLQDPIVADVERRLATWVQIPQVNAEDMQVLRYAKGQYYKVHMDSLEDDDAGLRVATVLLYFASVEEGGETAFPENSEWKDPSLATRQGKLSACTNGRVAYRPVKVGCCLGVGGGGAGGGAGALSSLVGGAGGLGGLGAGGRVQHLLSELHWAVPKGALHV